MATNNEVVRPVTNSSPSLWGDKFQHFVFDDEVAERYAEEMEVLKGQVRGMLVNIRRSSRLAEKLNFIDIIERLGISYHFEEEIDEMLEEIYNANNNPNLELGDDDLWSCALMFRLLRQHGYNISSGIFQNFQEDEKFKNILSGDIKGLLNLYEASHVKGHNDNILDEAMTFSRTHLEVVGPHLNSTLGRLVRRALEQPLHKGIRRVEISYFITMYEENESKNDVLLRFAKLDFNLLQMHHKQELYQLMRWWKELDFVTRLPYARDRAFECYFWAVGVYFEPKYSKSRLMVAKTIAMITIINDTYDSFGMPGELEIYIDAIQKWDISQMECLPDYMKISYKALIDLYDEFNKELSTEETYFAIYHAKERMKELVRAYNIESKWSTEECMAPFVEYLKNGIASSTIYLLVTTLFLGMKSITREAFEWLNQNPKIVEANAILGRIINDIGSYEREKNNSQTALTGVGCYMNDYGVSAQEAMDKFQEIVENAWKDINDDIFQPNLPISKEILMCLLNIARVDTVMYMQRQYGFTNPEKVMKPYIVTFFINSFEI